MNQDFEAQPYPGLSGPEPTPDEKVKTASEKPSSLFWIWVQRHKRGGLPPFVADALRGSINAARNRMGDPEIPTAETPRTSTVSPLWLSLDEMREEVWASAQTNHPGLTKEEFLAMSDAFGF